MRQSRNHRRFARWATAHHKTRGCRPPRQSAANKRSSCHARLELNRDTGHRRTLGETKVISLACLVEECACSFPRCRLWQQNAPPPPEHFAALCYQDWDLRHFLKNGSPSKGRRRVCLKTI